VSAAIRSSSAAARTPPPIAGASQEHSDEQRKPEDGRAGRDPEQRCAEDGDAPDRAGEHELLAAGVLLGAHGPDRREHAPQPGEDRVRAEPPR
jgi:hypothetical protein